MSSVRVFGAFLRRDFLVGSTYRETAALQVLGIILTALIWKFVAGAVAVPDSTPGLNGISYFAYVLVGLAFFSYFSAALTAFANKIRQEQQNGTLEAMVATPTSPTLLLIASAQWEFVGHSLRAIAFLAIGWWFGVHISLVHILPCLLVVGLTVFAYCGIGILAAAFVVYFKRGDPLTRAFSAVSALIGGIFFPPESMPAWTGELSQLVPITYSLRALRQLLLQGQPLSSVTNELGALALFAVVLVPVGVLAFRAALHRARVEGSLSHF